LFIGVLASSITLLAALVFSVSIKNLNVTKLLFVDSILILIAIVIFLLFLGLYEFLNSFHKLEEEIAELEDKLLKKGERNE